jgi:hypothetical protein
MWEVTKDHIAGAEGEVRDVTVQSPDFDDAKADSLIHPFRMFDDDGNLYYEGKSDDADSERAFDPLDDYGTPNAGCTSIKYWNGSRSKWELL